MRLTLRSKVDLIWTRAIRPVTTSAQGKAPWGRGFGPVIAQSVQFSKTAKKTEHRFMPFFFFVERRHCSYKNHEIKTRGHRTGFGGRAEESAHKLHFLRFLREEWGEFQNGIYVEGERRLFFGPFVCLFVFFFVKHFHFLTDLKYTSRLTAGSLSAFTSKIQ